MMKTTGFWVNEDEQNIYYSHWGVNNPKAVICLVHGLGEHIERYNHMAVFMNNKKLAVIGNDRRGHGRSEGRKGDTKSYQSFLNEVGQLIDLAKYEYPNTHIFIYGHSMGGNIVLNYGLHTKFKLAGIIATSPWLKLTNKPSFILLGFARFINLFGGIVQSNKINAKYISRDSLVVQNYRNDRYVHDKVSSVTIIGCIDAAAEVLRFKNKYPFPTLVIHGTKDALTSPIGSKKFVKNVSGDVNYHAFEGLYHECHNEPEKEQVLSVITNWLGERI